MIKDPEAVIEICRNLSYKFTLDKTYIEEEIRQHAAHTLCFALTPEHISGKLVNEAWTKMQTYKIEKEQLGDTSQRSFSQFLYKIYTFCLKVS